MHYVIGVDLGTSSVKTLLVNQEGMVVQTSSRHYPLIQKGPGFNEQDPDEWVRQTYSAIQELVSRSEVGPEDIKGLSFSGQMHGLVLLDREENVVRPAILWNDTRTTDQCIHIKQVLGNKLIQITRNQALEGFTLPKLLWVKEHEPDLFEKSTVFLLPKDYLRFRMTGQLSTDFSDAAGTLMMDVTKKKWSEEICKAFDIPLSLCPPLAESHDCVGTLKPSVAGTIGLRAATKVFAGGADNACGAIGTGVLSEGKALCSIGTSGVFLTYEQAGRRDYHGYVHFFNHGQKDAYYAMGVTLSAGYSLAWFKNAFSKDEEFAEMISDASRSPIGSFGLLFTPYLVGERTPYNDAKIRGTFIGIDGLHRKRDFVRSVMEGITFSINETVHIFRKYGNSIKSVVSIGGGAKSDLWLQMQADIFNSQVISLQNEQGPGMGAAMLAAVALGWYSSLRQCAEHFVLQKKVFDPNPGNVERYKNLFHIYRQIYPQIKKINDQLYEFKKH